LGARIGRRRYFGEAGKEGTLAEIYSALRAGFYAMMDEERLLDSENEDKIR